MKIAVYCGSGLGVNPIYAEKATELGTVLAKHGHGVIYGGSKIGLMGKVADATLTAGGEVIGVMPTHLQKQEIVHASLTEIHFVESMHVRKAKMVDLADAFIALPGGGGTLDEYFEVFTWAQIGLHEKPVILFNVNGFYDALLQHFNRMLEEGFIRAEHKALIRVATTAEEVLALIE
ncbi:MULTISPECIES: TIGR00730 family Rossman fold protein [unclassified Lysinibacillus]|uniref:LOG family protein n=1 Tax=unclassified Lysinibacillus TaxID=2636778 RepID=UPI00116A3116|nr:TIGR00730 family Rossman fold protein [Lysinibacillus sp. CD3-6]QPQ33674.1 TIGR00730 family Rossman fold protein [Lysinibacillus sp. JNUCC-52]UED80389.1 TIGR00730 family Rossman fold protein [Lysinibacillus sp. CD3-6]